MKNEVQTKICFIGRIAAIREDSIQLEAVHEATAPLVVVDSVTLPTRGAPMRSFLGRNIVLTLEMQESNVPHHCSGNSEKTPFDAHGHAIEGGCDEDKRGFFWVGNGEYASPVDFCPFCGVKAPRPSIETDQFRDDPQRGRYSRG